MTVATEQLDLTDGGAHGLALQMRDLCPEVVVAVGSQAGHLHAYAGDGTRTACQSERLAREGVTATKKSVGVYPAGWREWCPDCVARVLRVDAPSEVIARA